METIPSVVECFVLFAENSLKSISFGNVAIFTDTLMQNKSKQYFIVFYFLKGKIIRDLELSALDLPHVLQIISQAYSKDFPKQSMPLP